MSNNNPHSHMNQTAQNSSWNPLQIPSYIPRQPQLAHMSNERPMVRSPLAWHAAAPPPESLYNFMTAANHKNLEHSMNSLLPPYVRGPPPFDSMDLSLQSNRSTSSPLNKSAHSLVQPPPSTSQLDYIHKQSQHQHNLHQHQAQQQMHSQNNYPIQNLSTNSQQGQQHGPVSMQSVTGASPVTTQSSTAQNSGKFLNSNGSDCEQPALLIQTTLASSLSSNNGGSFQRHTAEGYGKIPHMNRNFENDAHSKPLQKPVELVSKDCSYTPIISSKLPSSHLLQQSSKKHSPVRGGGSGSGSYHIPQSPQQSPFNSPAPTGKHNGPHTPPTPHSPIMHQTQSPGSASSQQQLQSQLTLMHSSNTNAGVLDYNQLHLQQPHNSYSQTHIQQHLHHAYPLQAQHQQHWQQQPPPPNVVSLPSQHSHQTVPTHMQSPQINSSQQQQQKQSQQSHQTALSNLEATSPATPAYAANAETNFDQRSIEDQTAIVPSTATCASPRRGNVLPDTAESPDTSPDSNDDDSYDEKLLQSKQQMKKSPQNIKELESSRSAQAVEENKHHPSTSIELGITRNSNKSPKSSPSGHQRKPPQKPETDSPESLDLSSQRPISLKQIQSPPGHTRSPRAGESKTESAAVNRQPHEILKNGCTPSDHSDAGVEREVETIDKIAEMIAKTTSNSSHSSNSNDAHSNSSSKSARNDLCESPKTKKQRQALKLRNAEHNTDWSGNSYHDSNNSINLVTTATDSIPLTTNDDNAVLADDLGKCSTSPLISSRKRPMSPQTNSRSSSSSSSSSSCSNSSHSSCGIKAQKLKSSLIVEPGNTDGNSLKLRSTDKENVREGEMVQLKIEDTHTPDNQPLNLNCKMSTGANNSLLTPTSPEKSSFEEVENKLEEMFAGIEDETPPESKAIDNVDFGTTTALANKTDAVGEATDLSVALELSNNLSENRINKPLEAIGVSSIKSGTPQLPTPTPIQTKAAKKSTLPSPIKAETPEPMSLELNLSAEKELKEINKSTLETNVDSSGSLPVRKPMPRRRLSVALDPSNLRITLEGNEDASATSKKHPKPNETNKEVIVHLESDNYANEDSSKTTATDKIRQNKGNKNTKTTNTSKMRTGSGGTNTSSTGGAKATSKAPAKKNKQNQQKQPQQRRRKQSSSDEDIANTSTREAATSSSNANNNSDKLKSPFVLVKRDGSVTVVNAITAEDNGNDKQTKTKKPPAPYTQHERRNIRGFHSSTLSQKYDADTTDSTWICVFCKRGPHRMGLGDLFGPYLVTVSCEEYKNAVNAHDTMDVDAEFVSKRRRIDMVQCNARGPPVVQATKAQEALAAANRSTNKKKKKNLEDSNPPPMLHPATTHDPLDVSCETFLGMNKVSDNSYEVWLHEDCTVWAPDVFLVGARIMGLDGAVWNSTRYQCVLCAKLGATICCLERECKAAAHVPCAREALWGLNESNWHVHCHAHIKPAGSSNSSGSSNCLGPVKTAAKFVAQNPSSGSSIS